MQVERELAREAEKKTKLETEDQKVKKAKGLFKGFMKVSAAAVRTVAGSRHP